MAWLKRHLLLAIGGLIALGLLGTGTWYLLGNITRNDEAAKELDDQKHKLEELFAKDPFPHRTNIDAAKREIARMQSVIAQARQSFTPVAYTNVTGLAFKTLLDNTLDELQKKADKSSVTLPKNYEFSFAAQKKGLKFSPAIFPRINIQLAEVRTICNILFDSKINELVNVKRVRISADDPAGSADYLDNRSDETNGLTGAVLSPYQVELRCFSSELAAAMEGLSKSAHGLLTKALLVDVAPSQPGMGNAGQGGQQPARNVPVPAAGGNPAPAAPNPGGVPPRPGARPFRPPGGAAAAAKEGLETVLNEKLLKVILLIEVVKPGATK